MQKSVWAQNAACNAVVDLVDTGSDYSSGRINVYGTDSTLAAYFQLSIPAFRDATDGTSFANFIYDATVLQDSTAATFDTVNRDASNAWSGTVTSYSGLGDMKLNSIYLYKDSTISLSSFYYIVPR